jgi:endothelin-converting enzyme/putative endopeptidase
LNNNLADLTALQVAHDALARLAPDRNAEREFFSAYARSMRVKTSERALRGQVAGSPLAPAKYRVATVRNLDAWHTAFDVRPGQAWYLAPQARVTLW